MTPIDQILAPGRALELLSRRAARGQRPALRLLLQHVPAVIDAEERWLHTTLLKARPGAHRGAWRMAHDGEHEQMIELVANIVRGTAGRADPMFRALHGLLLSHVRAEREWLAVALAAHPRPDDPGFARYLSHCRPLLEAVEALSTAAATTTTVARDATPPIPMVVVLSPTVVEKALPLATIPTVASPVPGAGIASTSVAAEPARGLSVDAANDAPIDTGPAPSAPVGPAASTSPTRLATGT